MANTFNNITVITTDNRSTNVTACNLWAGNSYISEIQAPIIECTYLSASNSITTNSISANSIASLSNFISSSITADLITASNVNTSNLTIRAITGLSNVSSSNFYCESNITIRNSRYIIGGPSFNIGSDTSTVNTGIDLFAQAKNYMIYVARSSNFALSNSPSSTNSCAGVNFTSYAMRFRINNGSNFGFIFQDKNENPLFTINGDGLVYASSNIGIGKANAGYQLDLSTDGARKLTNTTWTTGSDQRIKTNIEDANLDICYSNIKQINLKRFKWDSNIIGQVEDESMLGFIAQEVKDVFPKSVKIISDYGFEDFHNLNTDQLIKSLFGAVKKLMFKVESLENIVLNK
jgi:hypothetical protein